MTITEQIKEGLKSPWTWLAIAGAAILAWYLFLRKSAPSSSGTAPVIDPTTGQLIDPTTGQPINLTGPAGPAGPAGPIGPTGAPGIAGTPDTTPPAGSTSVQSSNPAGAAVNPNGTTPAPPLPPAPPTPPSNTQTTNNPAVSNTSVSPAVTPDGTMVRNPTTARNPIRFSVPQRTTGVTPYPGYRPPSQPPLAPPIIHRAF